MPVTCSMSSSCRSDDDDLLTLLPTGCLLLRRLPTRPGLEVTGLIEVMGSTEVTVEVERAHRTVKEEVTGYCTSLGDDVSSTCVPVGMGDSVSEIQNINT